MHLCGCGIFVVNSQRTWFLYFSTSCLTYKGGHHMKQWCIILQIYRNICCSGGFNGVGDLVKIHIQSKFSVGLDLIINSLNTFVVVWFLRMENILHVHWLFLFLSPIFPLSRWSIGYRYICSLLNQFLLIPGNYSTTGLRPIKFTTVCLMVMYRMNILDVHMVMSWLMWKLRKYLMPTLMSLISILGLR